MKTADLTGAALDWAVAKCEGVTEFRWENDRPMAWSAHAEELRVPFSPSTDWAQGGPIIERERIDLSWQYGGRAEWSAWSDERQEEIHEGSTPLVAAMRCYVASKLGDEIDIPKELT